MVYFCERLDFKHIDHRLTGSYFLGVVKTCFHYRCALRCVALASGSTHWRYEELQRASTRFIAL